MAEMTSEERINKAQNLEEADRVPCAPMLSYYMAVAAGMTVSDIFYDLDKAEKAWEITYEKHGRVFDMCSYGPLISSHLDIMPDMFSTFYFDWALPGRERGSNMIPNLKERASDDPLMTEDDYDVLIEEGFHGFFSFRRAGLSDFLEFLKIPGYLDKFRVKWVVEKKVPSIIDLGLNGPFDILSVLRGSTNFMIDLHKRPEKIKAAIEAVEEGLIAAALGGAKQNKAKTIIMGAARGSADFISPKQFEELCLPFLVKASNAVVEAGYRLQYHMDTNWTPMLEYFKELPAKSGFLHMDERTDIVKAKEILGDHLCLFGNLKPSLFSFGTPAEVERQTRELIEKCAPGGGFILSAELPDMETKPENVQAMCDALIKYGSYS